MKPFAAGRAPGVLQAPPLGVGGLSNPLGWVHLRWASPSFPLRVPSGRFALLERYAFLGLRADACGRFASLDVVGSRFARRGRSVESPARSKSCDPMRPSSLLRFARGPAETEPSARPTRPHGAWPTSQPPPDRNGSVVNADEALAHLHCRHGAKTPKPRTARACSHRRRPTTARVSQSEDEGRRECRAPLGEGPPSRQQRPTAASEGAARPLGGERRAASPAAARGPRGPPLQKQQDVGDGDHQLDGRVRHGFLDETCERNLQVVLVHDRHRHQR